MVLRNCVQYHIYVVTLAPNSSSVSPRVAHSMKHLDQWVHGCGLLGINCRSTTKDTAITYIVHFTEMGPIPPKLCVRFESLYFVKDFMISLEISRFLLKPRFQDFNEDY